MQLFAIEFYTYRGGMHELDHFRTPDKTNLKNSKMTISSLKMNFKTIGRMKYLTIINLKIKYYENKQHYFYSHWLNSLSQFATENLPTPCSKIQETRTELFDRLASNNINMTEFMGNMAR